MLSSSIIAGPPSHSVIQREACGLPYLRPARTLAKTQASLSRHAAAWPAACAAQNTFRLCNAVLPPCASAAAGLFTALAQGCPGTCPGLRRRQAPSGTSAGTWQARPAASLSQSPFPQGALCPASPFLAAPAARFAPKGRLFRIQYNTAARRMPCFDSSFASCYHQVTGIKTRPGR